ncbi:hypothetical protein PVAP13_6NG138212 [Panicum virgatum]|uniref:Uncharacterized protein n=1 Tax=Panicum virgatum TaxID=38727 RepID=A0A8T0R011_PANVG|nr:hypothetical protein PVAP13_6NG138212 [Panicum virgatum]
MWTKKNVLSTAASLKIECNNCAESWTFLRSRRLTEITRCAGGTLCKRQLSIRRVRIWWSESDQACLPEEGQDHQEDCAEAAVPELQRTTHNTRSRIFLLLQLISMLHFCRGL